MRRMPLALASCVDVTTAGLPSRSSTQRRISPWSVVALASVLALSGMSRLRISWHPPGVKTSIATAGSERDCRIRLPQAPPALWSAESFCPCRDFLMRIAAVDLVSNTCFPALAADALGCFKDEGLEVEITLVPMLGATRALKDGSADAMIAGSVFDLLTDFPGWRGARLAVALSQGTPWLLTVRAD